VFGLLMMVVFVADIIYAAAVKNKFGVFVVIAQTVLITGIYGINSLYGFSWNTHSLPLISFMVLCIIPVLTIGLILHEKYSVKNQAENKAESKAYKTFNKILLIVLPVCLMILALMGHEIVHNTARSPFEYVAYPMAFSFIFVTVAVVSVCLAILIKKKAFVKNISLAVVIIILGCYSLYNFSLPQFALARDVRENTDRFVAAFGEDALKGNELMRGQAITIADVWFGMPTRNIGIDKDIKYFEDYGGQGIQLYYDVYYPTFASAHKSVLVRMHGRSNDRSDKNNAHMNKYFASIGYVVFDIQYGDFNEWQENDFVREVHWDMSVYQDYIREFFRFALANNNHEANFQSVFVSGHSFGGSMTCAFGLAFNNDISEYDELGIILKGIIPFYPYGNLADEGYDFGYLVNESSVPCLMIMGTHDWLWQAAFDLEHFYGLADNPHYAVIWINYGPHSFGSYTASFANQMAMYFMERFMENFR
jgi:dienelactone hydrolase